MSREAKGSPDPSPISLRREIRDALLIVLRDPQASASARAIAGRELLRILDEDAPGDSKPAAEMSLDEIDEEIARASSPQKQR